MNQIEELRTYIESAKVSGQSREDIFKVLLAQGFNVDEVMEACGPVDKKDVPIAPPVPHREVSSHTNTEEKLEQSVSTSALNSKQPAHEDGELYRKRATTIITTAGVLLVAVGIFSFVASNWQAMSDVLRVIVLLVVMMTAFGTGWLMRERFDHPEIGNWLIMLGCLIYGANIFLVAQIFNIRANWPDGFLLWMLGALSLGYVLNLLRFYYLAVMLGIVAIVGYPTLFSFGFQPSSFLLTSTTLLIITTVVVTLSARHLHFSVSEEIREIY